jgi:diadenosine tetraphosphate (Ap4A) HIT family hydrolase
MRQQRLQRRGDRLTQEDGPSVPQSPAVKQAFLASCTPIEAHSKLAEMNEFILHERLAAGSADLGRHGICRVLLKNQAHFLWIVLVPEVPASVVELHHLSEAEYTSVAQSIRTFSALVEENFPVDKINVASIGNQVNQLHIHVVGRRKDDIAWPGVVWACTEKLAYDPAEWLRRQEVIRQAMLSGDA